MVGGADKHELVGRHLDDRQAAARFGKGDDAQFDRAVQDVADHLGRSRILEIDSRGRELRHELADPLGQFVQANAVDGGDFHRSAYLPNEAPQALLQLVVGVENVLCLAVEHLAGGRQFHLAAAAHTLQQPALELVLERPYLLADRRLGDKVALGRERKTFEVDKIAKYLKRFYMHGTRTIISLTVKCPQ